MTSNDLSSANYWGARLGLALTPLFERDETDQPANHNVLLDGGFGSFALSVSDDHIWEEPVAADWSWSSNLPHHVTVTEKEVGVVRWDDPEPRVWTRSSVEKRMEQFYSYLVADRVQSSRSVTNHMLEIFRRARALVADANLDDDRSVDAYLAVLNHAVRRSGKGHHLDLREAPIQLDGHGILRSLSPSGVANLLEYATSRSSSALQLELVPSLAIRHAGSQIFQEAHFELLRTSGPDLFGYIPPPQSRRVTRGSTHFTPPALARFIAEQALGQVRNLEDRLHLTILDPACGSGSFLHEALRTLSKIGFNGRLTLVGRDTSRPAVSMAKFVLNTARAAWPVRSLCEIDICQGDSLADSLPPADVILMNPPFAAWSALTTEQRQRMKSTLGSRLTGRGDLSMAFVTRAFESLVPGGVLGTLLPASLLTLKAAAGWREYLSDQGDLRLIASLGDYGVFTYAMVQVAAAVLARPRSVGDRQESVVALVAGDDPEATGDALRTLRRTRERYTNMMLGGDSWRLFHIPAGSLRCRATWRLTSPKTEAALLRLKDAGRVVPMGDLFHVRQGVQTGLNAVFVLATQQVAELPESERRWFRPAVMNESIRNGEMTIRHRVFYPYDDRGLTITTEAELVKVMPVYFERYLRAVRRQLKERAGIVRAKRQDWWGLNWPRAWALDHHPRIISKRFGGPGGFATDLEGRYIVVQGFAWYPKWPSPPYGLGLREVLDAYMAIMNSRPFARLLAMFAPNVTGGQFDLGARFVNLVPMPNIPAVSVDESTGNTIASLASLGREARFIDPKWRDAADRLTTELLGGDIFDQG